jgi:hypothetical protein
LTQSPILFSVVASSQAHLLKMSRAFYNKIWKEFIVDENEIQISSLNLFPLFKPLTPQTKYQIVYENSYKKCLNAGDLIIEFDKKSPWNLRSNAKY